MYLRGADRQGEEQKHQDAQEATNLFRSLDTTGQGIFARRSLRHVQKAPTGATRANTDAMTTPPHIGGGGVNSPMACTAHR